MMGSHMDLPRPLRVFLSLCLGLTFISAGYFVCMWCVYPGPLHGMPVIASNPWLTDLLTTIRIMPIVHRPEFFTPEFGWIYPAPCIFIYELLLRPGMWLHHWKLLGYAIYLTLVLAGLLVLGSMLTRAMVAEGVRTERAAAFVGLTMLGSWPLWLGVHQGNIEVLLWFGTAAGAFLIFREQWMAAALTIGFVASFKLYPVLLLGMLLVARRYKEIAVSFAVFLGMSLLAMQYIGPSIPVVWHRIAPGIASFKDLGFYPGYVERQFLCFDHALIGLIRVLTNDNPDLMRFLGRVWIPVFAAVGGLVFFLRVWKMPRINQLLFLILAILLLPPKSYDYTLAMLYLPWAAMAMLAIRSARTGARVEGLSAMLMWMAIALSPMFFWKWNGVYFFAQVTCAVLLVLVVLCCRYPLAEPLDVGGFDGASARLPPHES